MKNVVVAIMGVPLSGKTTLGNALSRRIGVHFIDIDDGPARCALPLDPEPLATEEKAAETRKRMAIRYSVLHEAISANLRQGFPLIVAATYASKSSQEFLRRAVKENGGALKLIECVFNDENGEVERRIHYRHANGETGGCRSISTYRADKGKYEGPNLPHFTVNTSEGVEQAIKDAITYIEE